MADNNSRRNRMKNNKWSTKKKVLVSLLAVIMILVATFGTGYFWVKSKIYSEYEPTDLAQETKYAEVEGITNVLLIGTDARTLDEQSRSDSIIIATLDSNTKKIKLTSLFRDTMVNIPGYGENKINAAYALGGAELLLETIRSTYNINISKYLVVNFWGFEAVIDQMGGIEVDVKDYQLEELNKYIGESTSGNDCPVTETGLQTLNGKQALSYARIRKGVGDEFERTSRQQEVIMKVAEKMKETKPSKYLGIMNKMLDHIKTNIDPIEALNMAYTIYKFPSLQTEQLQLPIPELAEGRLYKDLGWVFLCDMEQNSKILEQFIYEDKMPNPEEYDMSSLRAALAKYASDEIAYNDIHGINPEDYDKPDEEKELPQVKPEKPEENKPPTDNGNGEEKPEPEKPQTENTAPIISGAANKEIFVGEAVDLISGVTASDKEDGDLTSKIIPNGSVDTSKAGVYTVTYSVTDSEGLVTTATITVTVKEKVTPPPTTPGEGENPPPATEN